MAGHKGGPAPKRPEERIRRNKPEHGDVTELTPEQLEGLPFEVETLVEPPEPDGDWHPAALGIYQSMLRDPARLWMGPTAWAIAWLMCENISREMKPQAIGIVEGGYDPTEGEYISGHVAHEVVPMKGATISAILKWAASNGVHESDRLAMQKAVTFAQVNQPRHEVSDDEVSDRRGGFFLVPGERE